MSLPPAHSPLRAVLPFCLTLVLLATVAPASSQVLRYREQTGDTSFLFSWQADTRPDGVTVTVTQQQGDEVFRSVNTLEGSTLFWQYSKDADTDVRVERVGNQLRLNGRFGGRPVSRLETIDERPWFQPLSYSLCRMMTRKQEQSTFWTIRPDTLDVLTMRAQRDGNGRLPQGDGAGVPANRVVIRPDGLLSALWSAEYWFRQADNLFVYYRATHGPPGVPETIISLVTH